MPAFFVERARGDGSWARVPVPDSSVHQRWEHEGDSPEAVVQALHPTDGDRFRVIPLDAAIVFEAGRPPAPPVELRRVPRSAW